MKIALIGSTRFIDAFNSWNKRLTLMGHIVYSVATVSTAAGQGGPTDDEKEILDLVHLLKIQSSDVACLITDEKGYVGNSTKREIKWCLLLGKQILLPEHFKGVEENFEGIQKAIAEALREQQNQSFKSKLDIGNIKI